MRELFLILEKLTERNVHYCFQQHGKSRYYNLMVEDRYGKQHYFNSDNLNEIEQKLKIIWGNLQTVSIPAKLNSLPIPPGFPKPR